MRNEKKSRLYFLFVLVFYHRLDNVAIVVSNEVRFNLRVVAATQHTKQNIKTLCHTNFFRRSEMDAGNLGNN